MNEDNFDEIPVAPAKKKKKVKEVQLEPIEKPKFDTEAAHRKVIMVMVGIFLAILGIMLLLQNHVDFASTGGM